MPQRNANKVYDMSCNILKFNGRTILKKISNTILFRGKRPNNELYKLIELTCNGLTFEPNNNEWTLRSSSTPNRSPNGEISVLMTCIGGRGMYYNIKLNK